MCQINECPICMEEIGIINCITTECGHKFHARCMITNIERNGFNCPYCRSLMAEISNHTDSHDDSDDDSSTDSGYTVDDNEYALLGLRLFTNLLDGEEHDQEDVIREHQYNEQIVANTPNEFVPPYQYVIQKLREENVTYEQLVAWILMDQFEYDLLETDLDRLSGDIWDKIQRIITNYVPPIEATVAATIADPEIPMVEEIIENVTEEVSNILSDTILKVVAIDEIDSLRVRLF